MIKIKFIVLGSLKEDYLRAASAEYIKRLSRYCDLEICEIEPVRLPEKPSQGQVEAALIKEAEQILKRIPDGFRVVSLCVEGKSFSSEQFAAKFKENTDMGKGYVFVVGSSYGLSQAVKARSDVKMSLSAMTFPHQLFRIMLLEQLYRAFKINEGSTYHK